MSWNRAREVWRNPSRVPRLSLIIAIEEIMRSIGDVRPRTADDKLHGPALPPILTYSVTVDVCSWPRAPIGKASRLSLVSFAHRFVFPRPLISERISFKQMNKKTGHRIRYLKSTVDTGERFQRGHHQGLRD